MTVGKDTGWLEMDVVDVRRVRPSGDAPELHTVLLRETAGDRQLPLGIGPFEAGALAMSLERAEAPRPSPYNLIASLLSTIEGRVREVRLSRLVEGTFYAEVVVNGPQGEGSVDARPSDAMNLALIVGAPIRVDASIVESAVDRATAMQRLTGREGTGSADIVADVRATWEGQARAASNFQ
jgi:bifunctional DNase/RNase